MAFQRVEPGRPRATDKQARLSSGAILLPREMVEAQIGECERCFIDVDEDAGVVRITPADRGDLASFSLSRARDSRNVQLCSIQIAKRMGWDGKGMLESEYRDGAVFLSNFTPDNGVAHG